jgi:hypothetical protein
MQDKNKPSYELAAYRDAGAKRRIVRDAMAGTPRLRDDTSYLPQHRGEDWRDYRERRNRSVSFNAIKRTIVGLVGMVFRRDLEQRDIPDEIDTTQIDGRRDINVFSRDLLAEAITDGHALILVDAPRWYGTKPLTRKEEKEHGILPYWVLVRADQVVNWRTERLGYRDLLAQVTIRERWVEADGPFGEEGVENYAVYRRVIRDGKSTVEWERWLRRSKGDLLKTDQGIIANITEIPLVGVYSNRMAMLESEPPLLDLAYTNIAHSQVQADHLTALHKASVPILVVKGAPIRPGEEIPTGPNTGLFLPDTGGAEYIEHSGNALGATRQQLRDFEAQMARLGMSMLQHETRAAETAEAKRIDKSEQDSALASTARSLQDGLNQALGFHAQMMGLADGGSVVVNRDFDRLTLDAAETREYSQLVANSQLSLETLWAILSEGGVLPDGFDPELERAHLDADMAGLMTLEE